MEEDINILEEAIKVSHNRITNPLLVRALENLIKGYRELKEINESFIWQSNFDMKFYEENYIPKSKIKKIRDKAEVMDYYVLSDVIDDLNKLLEDK